MQIPALSISPYQPHMLPPLPVNQQSMKKKTSKLQENFYPLGFKIYVYNKIKTQLSSPHKLVLTVLKSIFIKLAPTSQKIEQIEWHGHEKLAYSCLNEAHLWKFNPLHPNIRMHILHTVLHRFPQALMRRICSTIKSFLSWWSFPLFSWPQCLFKGWYWLGWIVTNHFYGLKG